jgi:hypothetical protein
LRSITMDEVQELSNEECNTPQTEPFINCSRLAFGSIWGSILCRDTRYFVWGYSWLSSAPPSKFRDTASMTPQQLHSKYFIIHPSSPYHLTLYYTLTASGVDHKNKETCGLSWTGMHIIVTFTELQIDNVRNTCYLLAAEGYES